MRNGVDFIPAENVVHERRVADIAENEFGRVLDRRAEPCRKIVENDNIFAGIEEGQHHMAADIACPACHQNRHAVTRPRKRFTILAQLGAKLLSYRLKMRAVSWRDPCQRFPNRFSCKPKGNRTEMAGTDDRDMFGRDPRLAGNVPPYRSGSHAPRYNPSEPLNAKDIGR